MSVGHGTPGLRDFLRTFSDLVDDVDADRRPILEFFPGVELVQAHWGLHSSGTYAYHGHIQYSLDGGLAPVAGAESDLGPLTRVESLALCVATVGTFYSQVGRSETGMPLWDDGVTKWDSSETWDQSAGLSSWDDGVTTWDSAETWDQSETGADLFVHLSDGSNPASHTVVALLGFYFGAKAEVHPSLGADKLTNGAFESLTGWTESLVGAGFSSALDSALFTGRGSTSSLKLVSTGAATGNATRYQDLTTVSAGRYWVSFDYRTDGLFSANLAVRLLIQNTAGTSIVYSDGRDADASGGITLKPTVGEWRRAMFEVLAPATTTRVQLQLLAASSAGAGQVNFDNVKVQANFGHQYYDPRLAVDSLPEVEVASQGIFFAGKTVGLGDFSLMNADGALDDVFGQILLKNKSARVLVGGAFPDGQELYRDDYRGGWPGLTQRVEADDLSLHFQTEDARARVHVTLPPRIHSLADNPDMELNEEGSGRTLVFATESWNGVSPFTAPILYKPKRVDLTSDGYGVYEVCDVLGSLDGLHAFDPLVWIYPTEEAAQKDVNGDRVVVSQSGTTHWSYDRATGLLTVLSDIRAYGRRRLNSTEILSLFIRYDIGGATITSGVVFTNQYTSAAGLAGSTQGIMRTASGAGDIFVTWSDTTKTFTFSKSAGTLNLTMDVVSKDAWEVFGFDTSTSRTGSLSYTAENATFVDVDSDHIIRIAVNGLRDDASGSITGTANAPVYKHPDVARYVLRQYLKTPSAEIDVSSFDAGRTLDTGGARIVLDERMESGDFLSRLELGALADLVVDGDRVWRWRAYQSGATVMRDFFDRDFLSFSCGEHPENIFKAVRVRYGWNPAKGTSKSYQYTADSGVPTKYGREEIHEFLSWMDGALDSVAQTQTQRLARLAAADPLVVTFTARGKLVDLLIGDVITITRTRALTSTGSLSATRFLVRALRHNFLTGISTCTAVEDVTFLS